jgi:hypothetical protein
MTVVIRRPIGSNAPRYPYVTVAGSRLPRPVLVQVLITDHVRRHIARRLEMIFTFIPCSHPIIKIVVAGSSVNVVLSAILTADYRLLPGSH